jgi:transcription initiation factor TFIID subunit 13
MYAFGDDPNPSPDSVAVLEDIVIEYINEMVFHPLLMRQWLRL